MKSIDFVPLTVTEGSRRGWTPRAGWTLEDRTGIDVMLLHIFVFHLNSFLRFYLFIFRERRRQGEREEEKHQCVVASHTPPTGDLAHNPSTCPDWELNQ